MHFSVCLDHELSCLDLSGRLLAGTVALPPVLHALLTRRECKYPGQSGQVRHHHHRAQEQIVRVPYSIMDLFLSYEYSKCKPYYGLE